MKYTIEKIEEQTFSGREFIFPVEEIQTKDYSKFYQEVCHNLEKRPIKSIGIYEIIDDKVKFKVLIESQQNERNYEEFSLRGGEYYHFEIDLVKNAKENQYAKAYGYLEENKLAYNPLYAYEEMSEKFNQNDNKMLVDFYIAKN